MEKQKKQGEEFAKEFQAFIRSGRSYVGMVAVLEDGNLRPPARILFHIISSLSYVEGYCFANNETLSAKLGLKETMIKHYLRELENSKLIDTRKVTRGSFPRREIYINFDEIRKRYNKTNAINKAKANSKK